MPEIRLPGRPMVYHESVRTARTIINLDAM
jgi:hypothetical protein